MALTCLQLITAYPGRPAVHPSQATQRKANRSGIWTDKPCSQLRKDVLQRHSQTTMHKEAQQLEATRLASERDGWIREVFSSQVVHTIMPSGTDS